LVWQVEKFSQLQLPSAPIMLNEMKMFQEEYEKLSRTYRQLEDKKLSIIAQQEEVMEEMRSVKAVLKKAESLAGIGKRTSTSSFLHDISFSTGATLQFKPYSTTQLINGEKESDLDEETTSQEDESEKEFGSEKQDGFVEEMNVDSEGEEFQMEEDDESEIEDEEMSEESSISQPQYTAPPNVRIQSYGKSLRNRRKSLSLYSPPSSSSSSSPSRSSSPSSPSPLVATSKERKKELLDEEEAACGLKWIGRRVKCWWQLPTPGFWKGTIVEVKRAYHGFDLEYKVNYDDGYETWEIVDDGFIFLNDKFAKDRDLAIKFRKKRGVYKKLIMSEK